MSDKHNEGLKELADLIDVMGDPKSNELDILKASLSIPKEYELAVSNFLLAMLLKKPGMKLSVDTKVKS